MVHKIVNDYLRLYEKLDDAAVEALINIVLQAMEDLGYQTKTSRTFIWEIVNFRIRHLLPGDRSIYYYLDERNIY